MRLLKWLRKLLNRHKAEEGKASPDIAQAEQLRAEFKARYHSFQLLLTANNKALEIMAEMEEALRGERPLGMSFIRSRSTRVATNVFQMLKSLNELATGKYDALYDKFVEIQDRVTPYLTPVLPTEKGAWVVPLGGLDRGQADQVGYKMASLGELSKRLNFTIPNGFVITAQAYRQFMEHRQLATEIEELVISADPKNMEAWHEVCKAVQTMIEAAPMPDGLGAVITRAYSQLESEEGRGVRVAMRSSALGEDTPGISFAGQYATEFNIYGTSILESYKRIVASKYQPQALTYRLNHGIRDDSIAMCVGCMPIVDSIAGGVAYSANPMNPKESAVIIQSVWGLPKPVADGSVASDLFVVAREPEPKIVRKTISVKDRAFIRVDDDYKMAPVDEGAGEPSLTDEQTLELARLALEIESYFGKPQDIEWALKPDGSFVLLQTRPLHQVAREPTKAPEETNELESHELIVTGGTTASPGVGAGKVFVARKEADILRFPAGSVLVVAQALPYWATVLDRASAVVTEQGSLVGHLASVAREFKVPAIFGIWGVTERLETSREVTVDAGGRRIYDGRVATLSETSRAPASYLTDSPVYKQLKGASAHIIPLRLLDPDSPDFKPQKCSTFHDITRFCHEKAVREMFQFGTDRSFPERAARQLHVEVPMQFWVIDLDDGFAEGTPLGQFIKLPQITSVPMLALWRGMTAIPWSGPPPVDTKGFMSVLVESATDPSLDPSMRQKFAARNYFMVSKNFCSLQSRFGYHFSTLEALVSERASENYVSFQFKGGAASIARRSHRAQLVAEIMEEYGFRTDLEEDCTRARLEGYDQAHMEKRLEIVGYLIIHTRQLDMVMANTAAINAQKERMHSDLEKIVTQGTH
jgi:pyruvate,water dikinase